MEPPLRLLSLDGGGIRGLSSLYIIRDLMHALRRQVKEEDPSKEMPASLRPCEYFDMIAGTSTGGLIAVMLGILRMDIQTCIDAYLEMAPKIFPIEGVVSGSKFGLLGKAASGNPRFNPTPLELAVKDLVKKHLGPGATGNEKMRSISLTSSRVFVCASSEQPYMNYRFRTYDSPKAGFDNVAIWEACRATSAAPTYFPPVSIGNPPQTYVDGGLGYNNPTRALLEEATDIWPSRGTGCIVSIGCGMAGLQDVGRTLKPLMETLKSISTDTEKVAREVKEQMAHQYPKEDMYFRFNVQHGLQDVGLEEWKEFGRVKTVTEDYSSENRRQFAACASRLLSRINSYLTGSVPAMKRSYTTIPYPKDDDFVGRDSIMTQLDTMLSASGSRRWAALFGLGGIGKSQIAIEYCYRVREVFPSISTFWVHASSEARFEQSFSEIATKVGIAGNGEGKQDSLQAVSAWLSSRENGDWFLILDNADDTTFLVCPRTGRSSANGDPTNSRLLNFVPQVPHGTVLITTRDRQCALELVGFKKPDTLHVDTMSSTESIQLVRRRLPNASEIGALELVEELGNVPLAVTQASAYIVNNQEMPIAEYLAEFRRSDEDQAALLNVDNIDLRRDAGVPNAVIISWELSFNQIRREREAAADLLSLMSYYHRQGIPRFLLRTEEDERLFRENINPLLRFSMVRAEIGGQTYAMHRLVQKSTRYWLRCKGLEPLWKGRVMQQLVNQYPSEHNQAKRWTLCEALMSHADEVLSHAVDCREWELNCAKLLGRTAWYLIEKKGHEQTAERRSRLALELQRKYLEESSDDILATLGTLAYAIKQSVRFEEARVLEQSIFEQVLKVHGPEHLNTVHTQENLAASYYNLGQYVKAVDLLEATIKAKRRLLVPQDSSSMLNSMVLLAIAKAAQRQFEEAEKLYDTILEESTRVLGAEHMTTLDTALGLAQVYKLQHRFNQAKNLCQKVDPICNKVHGRTHWRTLVNILTLAETYYDECQLDEAEELCMQCVKSSEERYGKRDICTLDAKNLLGLIYRDRGTMELAVRMFEEIVEPYREALGSLHPKSLSIRFNLALCYHDRGDKVRATDTMEDILQKRKEVLGENNPYVTDTANCLANWQSEREAAAQENPTHGGSDQGIFLPGSETSHAELDEMTTASYASATGNELYERSAEVEISSLEAGDTKTKISHKVQGGRSLFGKKFTIRRKKG